jgi:hypothetical protein
MPANSVGGHFSFNARNSKLDAATTAPRNPELLSLNLSVKNLQANE